MKKYKLLKGHLSQESGHIFRVSILSYYRMLFEKYCDTTMCTEPCLSNVCLEDGETYQYTICPSGTLTFTPIECQVQNIAGILYSPCQNPSLWVTVGTCNQPSVWVDTKPCPSPAVYVTLGRCQRPYIYVSTARCYSSGVTGVVYNDISNRLAI